MRAVLRFLGSRWFLSFIGVVLLSVLVWLFGPFLAFLDDWITRAIVIAYVRAHPYSTPKDIATGAGLNYDTVKRACARIAQRQERPQKRGAAG